MDGWNTIVSFWDGLFSGAKMLVSGRVVFSYWIMQVISPKVDRRVGLAAWDPEPPTTLVASTPSRFSQGYHLLIGFLKGGGDFSSLPYCSLRFPQSFLGILEVPQLPSPLEHPPLKNPYICRCSVFCMSLYHLWQSRILGMEPWRSHNVWFVSP